MVTMDKFRAHFTFELLYKRYGIDVARVSVSVLNLPNGDDFVLFTDLGQLDSVSNQSELIATRIRERLGLDEHSTQWGEHYKGMGKRIDLVSYTWDPARNKYTHPRWNKAPQWLSDYVFDVLSRPSMYSLN